MPKDKGFDEEATRRAQATAKRAQESAGARGEDANEESVDEGPAEDLRRTRGGAEAKGAK